MEVKSQNLTEKIQLRRRKKKHQYSECVGWSLVLAQSYILPDLSVSQVDLINVYEHHDINKIYLLESDVYVRNSLFICSYISL